MSKPLIEYLRRATDLARRLAPVPDEESGDAGDHLSSSGGIGGRKSPTVDIGSFLLSTFNAMIRRVEDNYITVGIIGITSSGKSSVINAMMGRRLLVQRVRPSSNIIVNSLISHGSSVRVEICFAGKESEIHESEGSGSEVDGGLGELLKKYSDESENEGNGLGVELIKIWTPEFRLGDGVMMADTPGLKAYSFPKHEELTWAFLAPMVDVAVFLCTAKSESDADHRKYLKRLKDYGKDTVVVQNMKDSVEPELGEGGAVRKTREENLLTLRKRLARNVAGVFGEGGLPPIYQVSAKEAAEPATYAGSGFPELVGCLRSKAGRQQSTLEAKRGRDFVRELAKLLPSGGGGEGGERERLLAIEAETASLELTLKSIAREEEEFATRCGEIAFDSEQRAQRFRDPETFRSISLVSDKNLARSRADKFLDDLHSFESGSFASIIKLVEDSSRKATGLGRVLGMEEKEFRDKHMLSAHSSRSRLTVPTEKVDLTRQVKQKSVFGGLKRLCGSVLGVTSLGWGLEEEPYTEDVVDFETLGRKVGSELADFSSSFALSCQHSLDNVSMWFSRLAREARTQLSRSRRQEELRRRIAGNAEVFKDFDALLAELIEAFPELPEAPDSVPATDWDGPGHAAAPNWAPSGSDFETVRVAPAARELARLCMTAGASARLSARNHYLSESGIGSSGRAVVLGWDSMETDSFLSNFWFDYNPGREFGFGRLADRDIGAEHGTVHAVQFRRPSAELPELIVLFARNSATASKSRSKEHLIDFSRVLDNAAMAESCVFYLMDGMQLGASVSTLAGSPGLVRFLMTSRHLVLTLRSFSQFSSGTPDMKSFEDFAEYLILARKIFDRDIRLPIGSFMANCTDLGISVLGDRFFKGNFPLKAEDDPSFYDIFGKISDPAHFGWFLGGLHKARKSDLSVS
ncbi:MAG: dynamin family protein [Deltaproteobacteria bacterium]|jgi:GTP-binding protein EngB required for normal cell division|nr:dynamin family protein [Deltaproteobacteria bacterium]